MLQQSHSLLPLCLADCDFANVTVCSRDFVRFLVTQGYEQGHGKGYITRFCWEFCKITYYTNLLQHIQHVFTVLSATMSNSSKKSS